jgi:hypothetical protein
MDDYASYLLSNKIITDGRQKNTAETIILNSNLFNLTGNGGLTIELDEFVPFAVNVLSSMKISQLALDYFNLRCGNSPEVNEITTACYKQYFYEAFFNESNLKPFVPRMISEIESYNKQDELQFIDEVQHFSRLCPYPDSFVTKGDIMAAVMGFYSIENSMIMFEKNGDNMLNPDEVMDPYNFFEDALKRLLKTSDNEKQNIAQRLSKAIFYYLVDYNKTPESASDLMKVLAYQLRIKRPDGADRVTLAAILKTISTTSTTNRLNPGFCPRPTQINTIQIIQEKFDVRGVRFANHLTQQMEVPQRLNANVIASFASKFGVDDTIDMLDIFVMNKSITKFEMAMILLDLTDYHKDTIGKKAIKKIKKWAKKTTFIDL